MELITVFVPLTVRSPVTITLLENVLLPPIVWSPVLRTAFSTSAFRASVKLFCVNPPSPTV